MKPKSAYTRLGELPDEEAVELLESFGTVPDWVEAAYIARFRKMQTALWELAYRVFYRRSSIEANSTPSALHYVNERRYPTEK